MSGNGSRMKAEAGTARAAPQLARPLAPCRRSCRPCREPLSEVVSGCCRSQLSWSTRRARVGVAMLSEATPEAARRNEQWQPNSTRTCKQLGVFMFDSDEPCGLVAIWSRRLRDGLKCVSRAPFWAPAALAALIGCSPFVNPQSDDRASSPPIAGNIEQRARPPASSCESNSWPACEAECHAARKDSCLLLAAHYFRGCSMWKSEPEKGDCSRLKELFADKRVAPAQLISLFQKGCSNADGRECFQVAAMYFEGAGVPRDQVQAAQLYKQSCDAGFAQGCYNLGVLYNQGVTVPGDKAKGAQLYKRACDSGFAPACNNLAVLYEDGTGVAKNQAEAAQLYKQACDGGFGEGCFNLAVAYEQGVGVAHDPIKAKLLLGQACEAGVGPGCQGGAAASPEGSRK